MRHVQLFTAEIKLVEFVAQRAGEIPFDLGKARPDARAMVERLISLGVVETTLGPGLAPRPHLRLTDVGRQIAEQIDAMVDAIATAESTPSS